MIVDRLENWARYFSGAGMKTAFEFLQSLDAEAEVKQVPLQGDEVYAMVVEYETRGPEDAVLETHRKYVDIQVMLAGRERLEWFPVEGLAVRTPYDADKDVTFYDRHGTGPTGVDMAPGLFVALFPEDAHMPSLMTGSRPAPVKKAVVKITCDLAV